jgi:simple sugar transport system ATP-binding protein
MTDVSLRHITKRFGTVVAIDDASLDVVSGEVHAILGENGAGKTSLMNVLAGIYRADEGEIVLDGQPVDITSPRDAKRLGIGMVHQEQRLVARFTAPENVSIGHREPRFLTLKRYFRDLAENLSERYRLQIDAESPIWTLPIGRRQRVELVKLLHHGARVIILDEPTGNLAPAEVTTFFEAMRRLAAEGRTIILITHKLDEVLRFADRVTVMRAGRVVSTFAAAETSRVDLNRLMIGEVVVGEVAPAADTTRDVVLQVSGLSVGDPHLRDSLVGVNLAVRAGEIVGLAGVAGNGQTRLAEAISGNVADFAGEVTIAGRSIRGRSPREVARLGVGYIPENRKEVGLVLGESVAVNLALRRYDRPPYSRSGWLDRRAMTETARDFIERYEIRTPSPETPVGRLSGGNQQRVIVARELADDPTLIVADNFTRGLDPRSTSRFQQELFGRRDRGAAVLWITGDLAEALLCDRIAVMRQGRIVAVLDREDADAEPIGLLMSGNDEAGEAAGAA